MASQRTSVQSDPPRDRLLPLPLPLVMRRLVEAQALLVIAVLLMGLGSLFAPRDLTAQDRWVPSLDAQIGITFPAGDLSADGMDGWPALRLGAELPVAGRLGAYAAVQRHTFRCGGDCAVLGTSPVVGGWAAGLTLRFPSPQEAEWWARVGVMVASFSSDLVDGDVALGGELAFGVEIPVRRAFYLNPAASAHSLEISDGSTARYLSFGVGLTYRAP